MSTCISTAVQEDVKFHVKMKTKSGVRSSHSQSNHFHPSGRCTSSPSAFAFFELRRTRCMNSSMVAVDAAMVMTNSAEMALLLLLFEEEAVAVFAAPALDQMSPPPDVAEDQMPRMRVKHCMDVRARVCLSRLLR